MDTKPPQNVAKTPLLLKAVCACLLLLLLCPADTLARSKRRIAKHGTRAEARAKPSKFKAFMATVTFYDHWPDISPSFPSFSKKDNDKTGKKNGKQVEDDEEELAQDEDELDAVDADRDQEERLSNTRSRKEQTKRVSSQSAKKDHVAHRTSDERDRGEVSRDQDHGLSESRSRHAPTKKASSRSDFEDRDARTTDEELDSEELDQQADDPDLNQDEELSEPRYRPVPKKNVSLKSILDERDEEVMADELAPDELAPSEFAPEEPASDEFAPEEADQTEEVIDQDEDVSGIRSKKNSIELVSAEFSFDDPHARMTAKAASFEQFQDASEEQEVAGDEIESVDFVNEDLDPLPPQRDYFDPGINDDPNADMLFQVMPAGLMYRSYLAGEKESRISSVWHHDQNKRTVWENTLGGRIGLLRYGTTGAYRPQGWQLDFEGAAMPRVLPGTVSTMLEPRLGSSATS